MIKLENISPEYMKLYPKTLHNQGCENLTYNTGLDVHLLTITWYDAWTPEVCSQKSTAEMNPLLGNGLLKHVSGTTSWNSWLLSNAR
jgi:hypothetical protein